MCIEEQRVSTPYSSMVLKKSFRIKDLANCGVFREKKVTTSIFVLFFSNKYMGVIIWNKIFKLLVVLTANQRNSISNYVMVTKCEITRLNEKENTYLTPRYI